ncbi:MAG: ABC-type transporter, integral rane subunit, partial [Solirubrobacterales bacterium]|nr:ABC-type transporter, integral rane subunit [Solirubrobacterales bacterium]
MSALKERVRRRPASRAPSRGGGGEAAERYGLLVAWAVLALAFVITESGFRSTETIKIIFGSQSTQLIITLAVVVVLLAGEFDLSVGAVVSVASTMLVYFNGVHHWPILLALLAVAAIVVGIGVANAVLVLAFGVPSIVVTLGMATLIAGVSHGIAGEGAQGGVSQPFVDTIGHQWVGLPIAFYIALAVGIGLYYVVEHTPWGRYLVFVGRGRDVARLAGLREQRYRAAALIAGSVLAGLAGVLLVGLTGATAPSSGDSYLLPAFAGAFLGATTIKPGQFNVWGSFVAVYFLVTGVTGLQLLGYTGWVEDAFYGGSLLIAVVATQIVARHRARNLKATA